LLSSLCKCNVKWKMYSHWRAHIFGVRQTLVCYGSVHLLNFYDGNGFCFLLCFGVVPYRDLQVCQWWQHGASVSHSEDGRVEEVEDRKWWQTRPGGRDQLSGGEWGHPVILVKLIQWGKYLVRVDVPFVFVGFFFRWWSYCGYMELGVVVM